MQKSPFYLLQKTIIECRRCPRLVAWRERIASDKIRRFKDESYWGRPIPAFGDADAGLVIVGLAPAAHGGNRTGRMFTGDSSGDWLFEALHHSGFAAQPFSLRRDDGQKLSNCLITAALRCAPPRNKPLPQELANCHAFLRRELQMLDSVRVLITLGQIAFRAFIKAWRDNGRGGSTPSLKFRHGGEWPLDNGVMLISSYHPSRQNTQTGKLTRVMFREIFCRARRILENAGSAGPD